MAKKSNHTIDQGATFRGIGTVRYPDGTLAAADMTHAIAARMQMRQKYGAQDTVLDISTDDGGLAINTVGCTVKCLITADQTAALLPANASTTKTFVYDVIVLFSNRDQKRDFQGTLLASPAVTASFGDNYEPNKLQSTL